MIEKYFKITHISFASTGVFKEIVEWCLVVTTHEEAIICALARESMTDQQQQQQSSMSSPFSNLSSPNGNRTSSYNNQSDTHLKLIPTRYLIPTDSVPMLSICGTDDGRIFMGGYDGCLYEMSYEGIVPSSSNSSGSNRGGWYEDDEEDNHDNYSVVNTLASGSKRAISTLLFGPSSSGAEGRSRKCRKVNHTSLAPEIVSAFVPGFVLNAASYVFGSNASTRSGGPIVKLTLDEERKTMYALTSKGFIHAFDLDTDGTDIKNNTIMQPKLACTINVSKSVRRYLDCVAHGRMYAPSVSTTDSSISSVHFPGGGAAAQAGVGGMEGARSILKIADSEMMRKKQRRQAAARSSNRNGNGRGRNTNNNAARIMGAGDGCLHPISIHVIPPSESKFLTLVAISSAGLRYYLSVLPDAGTSRYGNTSVKPGRRFSLCHIRAPPPLSISSDDDVVFEGKNVNVASTTMGMSRLDAGVSPFLQGRNGTLNFEAKNGCYTAGGTLLALASGQGATGSNSGGTSGSRGSTQRAVGDSILVMTPDYTSQDERHSSYTAGPLSSYMDTTSSMGTSGLGEVVSQPMRRKGDTSMGATVMAGGHVWDITVMKGKFTDQVSPSILNLYSKSSTPSDSILESDVAPPFIPPSTLVRRSKGMSKQREASHHSTSLQAAKSASERKVAKSNLGFFNGGVASLALNIFGNMLFSKPATVIKGKDQVPTYRVSEQSGCRHGFSSSALETSNYGRKSSSRSRITQSRRIQSTLLHPSTTPLPEMSLQHLTSKIRRQGLIALNSGGLHYFSHVSPLDKLQRFLMESNTSNIGRDENIKVFFSNYGQVECSALCLSIAIDDQASDKLARIAIQAALRFANRPRMVPTTSEMTPAISEISMWNSIPGFEGYIFRPSSLHDGLLALISRLLRPIWCKPAVVVTEGKITQPKRRGQRPRIIPAKVELLLDETTLDCIRRPLARLQFLLREVFQPAVNIVPGSKTHLNDTAMDTDESESFFAERSNLMTSAVRYQSQASSQTQDFQKMKFSEKELLSTAQLYEERSIHAIYRIVSRSVQLLTLMSRLRRAHNNPALPEVDFGFLHGKSYAFSPSHLSDYRNEY